MLLSRRELCFCRPTVTFTRNTACD